MSNDEDIASDFILETINILRKNYSNYELVLVDDGSMDNTVRAVEELLIRHDCIRLIRLSRRFGIETAISAGLDSAIGDYVVVIIPNDDPPSVIPEMISLCQNGPGVVTGVRPNRRGDPFWAKVGAKFFYLYTYRFLQINIPENSTPFRVLSRQAVNAITQIRDQYRYIRLISNFIGYAQVEFQYTPINRSGRKHGRSFWESANMALDIIVANSLHPLRVVTILGLFAGLLNLLYISYIILIYFFKDKVAEGWVTTNFQSAVMFFFIFVILTVLSEYVGRIMNETRKRPLYYVLDEMNSSVMLANSERRNIVGLDETSSE